MNNNNSLEDILTDVKEYAELRFELVKLKTVDKFSLAASSLATRLILLLVSVIFLLMANIGLALYLGYLLGENYYGFLIMAGFYLLLGVVFFLGKEKWFRRPLRDLIIKKTLD